MEVWDYKVRELRGSLLELEDQLNELGKDGWELCTQWQPLRDQHGTWYLRLVFKRQVGVG